MFENLSDRLTKTLKNISGKGRLTEDNIKDTLREVRMALLEADVALPVIREFIAKVKERAVGQDVSKSLTPGQVFVKIVRSELETAMGEVNEALNLKATPPAVVLMAGLQGAGKTTSVGKLAKHLTEREKKKVLMASLDTRRPAAMEQLQILGEQAEVKTLPIIAGQSPRDIANRAMEAGKLGGYDVVMLDTAGRLSIDEQLMTEIADINKATNPIETLLVVDALTGQDAVQTAEKFKEQFQSYLTQRISCQ